MSEVDLVARTQKIVGYQFADSSLLITALTHASGANSRLESNERQEFLGDAVLGMVVCAELFRRYPDWLEGDLTKVKSVVVSRRICAEVSDEMGLTGLLILGNGIDAQENLPTSLRAAVLESIIGAIYLDGGFEAAQRFIIKSMSEKIVTCATSENRENYKSALQQYAQRWMSATPQYEALDEQGPDHSKCFEVCVVIDNERYPSAWGPCKKDAEQEAAHRALDILTGNGKNEDRSVKTSVSDG